MTIDELYYTVSINERSTVKEVYLEKFKEIYWSLSDEDKQKKLEIISKTFFHILKIHQYSLSEIEINRISELIASIAVTQIPTEQKDSFICGEYEFFRLLYNLSNNDTSNSAKVYELLGEDITDVDWIFSLKKMMSFYTL